MPSDQNTMLAWNVGEPPPTAPKQLNLIQRALVRMAGVNPAQLVNPQAAPVPVAVPDTTPEAARELKMWEQLLFLTNRERLLRYRDYDEMDYGDIASQLDVILDSVLVSDDDREQSFKVEVKNRNINNLCQGLIRSTALQSKVRQFLRELLKYGDVPIALWFDASYNIIATQLIDPYFSRRRIDRYGRLMGGIDAVNNIPNAYWQVDYLSSGVGGTETPINGWLPWQMVWLKWRENDRFIYSQGSYLEDMRRDWMKLRYSEASLPIARFSSAYPRRVMQLDVTGQDSETKKRSVAEFRRQLGLTELHNVDASGNIVAGTQARNPLQVADDIYIGTAYRTGPDGKLYPQLNSVTLEDPRIAGLENVADLEYQRRKLYRRLSRSLMGDGVNSTDLTPQDMAAARMFQHCAWILEYRLIRPLLELQCALKGYTLEDKDLTVKFSNQTVKGSWRFSDAMFRASMADKNALTSGTTTVKRLLQDNEQFTEEDWKAHIAQLKAEKELRDQGVLPPLRPTNSGANAEDGGTKTGKEDTPNVDRMRGGNNSA